MGGRAVDCDGLENRCGGNSTGGSNPSPSARNNQNPDNICRGFVFRRTSATFIPRSYQYVQRSYQIIEYPYLLHTMAKTTVAILLIRLCFLPFYKIGIWNVFVFKFDFWNCSSITTICCIAINISIDYALIS